MHANTKDDAGFVVPEVKWGLSSKRVMTLGWGEGIPANELERLRAAGLDMAALGNRVLQLFLSHALRDGFFHGDMHQGNLKFAANGDIIALDFGIMGRIDEYTRRVYAEILFGFIRRDYRRVAEVHFEAGYVPADRDVDEFAQALRAVGEPIFGMDATRISMGRLLHYLFEVTEWFGMQTRTELILLQRTMVVVEGVSRSLNPQINIWDVAHPVVEDYIKTSIGPRAIANDLARTARVLSRFGPRLPGLVEDLLIAQARQPEQRSRHRPLRALGYFGLGVLSTSVLFWLIACSETGRMAASRPICRRAPPRGATCDTTGSRSVPGLTPTARFRPAHALQPPTAAMSPPPRQHQPVSPSTRRSSCTSEKTAIWSSENVHVVGDALQVERVVARPGTDRRCRRPRPIAPARPKPGSRTSRHPRRWRRRAPPPPSRSAPLAGSG